MIADKSILVTGAAGFIGFHLARRLLASGVPVTGVDSMNDYYDPALKEARIRLLEEQPGFRFHRLDLSDDQALRRALDDQTFCRVYHLAAQAGVRYSLQNPGAYIRSNILGFFNVLEYCREFPPGHLVYASSSSVYGNRDAVPFREEQNTDHPISLYAATKKSNEAMAHSYSHLFGTPATGLRFFTVYGPWGRPDMAIFSFTRAILEGQPIQVFAGGELQRDFTYIDDIIEGLVHLGDKAPATDGDAAAHRILNIGNGSPVRVNDMIEILEDSLGMPARRIMAPMQDGDVVMTCADTSPLVRLTGFRPDTSLRQGIAEFVRWYREYYQLPSTRTTRPRKNRAPGLPK